MDICFEKDFEERVDKKLNELGIRTIRNVYVKYGNAQSQIDIMAFTDNSVWCIECKSHNILKLIFGRSKSEWKYYDINGKFGIMKSPKKQNANHISTAWMQAVGDIDFKFYAMFGSGVMPINNAVVFKSSNQLDNLDEYTRRDCCIYTEANLELLKTDLQTVDDRRMIDVMYEYFSQFTDNSKEREKEHIKYLKNCKKNKTGLFAEG